MLDFILLAADGSATFCQDLYEPLHLVGTVVSIIKWVISLIIIVLGIIDLAKIVISAKPEEIKKGVVGILWRIAGVVIIIFLPLIIMKIFGLVNGSKPEADQIGDANVCEACIVRPSSAECHGR